MIDEVKVSIGKLKQQTLFIQLCIWTAFALLTRFTWLNAHPPGWDWIFSYVLLGFLVSFGLLPLFRQIQSKPKAYQIIIIALSTIIAGLVWRVLFNTLEYHVLESSNNQFKFWGYFHNGKSSVTQLLVWAGGYWIWFYQNQLQQHKLEQKELLLDAQQARLKMLQYQIAPHFLFNVLSSLDTLILKGKNADARNMLEKLSDYLRYTLQSETNESQSLYNELEHCKQYLELMRYRFQENLQIQWSVPDEVPVCLLPHGLLLPLFENIFKHGQFAHEGKGTVKLKLAVQAQELQLEISNSVDEAETTNAGFGIGLRNTKERIRRFFGENAKFQILQNANQFTAALTIKL